MHETSETYCGRMESLPVSEANALGTRYTPPSGDSVGLSKLVEPIGGSRPPRARSSILINFRHKKTQPNWLGF